MQAHALGDINVHQITLLLTISACVAAVVQRIKIPYTVALVVVGLGLSFFHLITPIELSEELVLFIFLPALLFEAAWNLNVHYIKETWKNIGLMATLGVVLAIACIGFGLHALLHLPLLVCLLFGAVIAPTDPVSVVAIMKKLHLDHRLSALVEGESLFNDGTSVVFFKLILAILLTFGLTMTQDQAIPYLGGSVLQFLGVVGGGSIIGGVFGYGFSKITRFFNDHLLELTFTTIAAYGSFLTAELIGVPGIVNGMHFSGVIATVTAGLVMGNFGRQTGMSASTQIVVSSFWEYAAFAMNSLLFLLVGLEIQLSQLVHYWMPITVAIVVVVLARAIAVYGLSLFAKVTNIGKIPFNWQHVLVAGGLRGALSMALILSIPRGLLGEELRELLIVMTFGVVLFTLLVQGLSIGKLLQWLKLGRQANEQQQQYEKIRAQMACALSALKKLAHWQAQGEVTPLIANELSAQLNTELTEYKASIEAMHLSHAELVAEDREAVEKQLLVVKKATVTDMVNNGFMDEEIGQELKTELDDRLLST